MNNRKYIVLQCYHVNVLTLSSPRQAKRYPANPLSCESRVCTTLDKNQMTSRFIKLIKDRFILFFFCKGTKYSRSLCSYYSLFSAFGIKYPKKSTPFSF